MGTKPTLAKCRTIRPFPFIGFDQTRSYSPRRANSRAAIPIFPFNPGNTLDIPINFLTCTPTKFCPCLALSMGASAEIPNGEKRAIEALSTPALANGKIAEDDRG
jgi:hypothetical protein